MEKMGWVFFMYSTYFIEYEAPAGENGVSISWIVVLSHRVWLLESLVETMGWVLFH